ncbi:nitronate monooxygenase [Methylohalomonas lacus]|uniref:Nitronate monooxygenase n=1 Tax=Methylohalomonas lacus TaxID=398773 RepID=A0AAE3HMU7_9GAMM|nr:nitronate monooxygenase [Methylohalomonas lacus]MCS3903373.1 nitronate monooxygenase [Methylohalomonas lacus]
MPGETSIQTSLTQLLDIKHPILLAPMAGIADGELAAAVSAAGGLGILGGGYGDRDWLEAELAHLSGKPFAIGFITWSLANQPALLDVALAAGPHAIMLSFGDLAPFVEKIKAADCLLIAQVQTLAQARQVADQGADVIVAQGTEAGGHGASRATLPLVPALVDAVDPLPVVAAGGISDGRGLAAALMLGAAGVLMGSRFYVTEESGAHPVAKAAALAADGDRTLRSSVFDELRGLDWPQPYTLRSLRNDMTENWHGNREALEAVLPAERARLQAAIEAGDFRLAPLILGEGVDLITDSPPAGVLVERLVAGARAQLERHAGRVASP